MSPFFKFVTKHCSLNRTDHEKETTLRVDALSKGLGVVLLQKDIPVALASISLTDTEQRYANVEREMLEVVYGCERFHTYIYGKRFIVDLDHKPPEMIHSKNVDAAPQRLQRLCLRIQ